jgi:TrmH family RNA methyltransferase
LKSVIGFANSPYQIHTVYHTAQFDPKVLNLSRKINFQEISFPELEKISSLKSPREVIAMVQIPQWPPLGYGSLKKKFTIALDGVQDPGNLGTIVRTADWFGISTIVCSEDTVDVYNPKVVQASMGSLAQVEVHYTVLQRLLAEIRLPVFGAMLEGDSIYATDFGDKGILLMGNEGNGLRPELQNLISKKVTIPRVGKAESLNVAIATALFCAEASRKTNK